MAKVKSVVSFDAANPQRLIFKWGDGVESVFDLGLLKPEVLAFEAWHGTKQQLQDVHAGTFKDTGSIAACRAESMAKWESLVAGETHRERTATPWVYEAIAEIWGVDEDVAAEKFEALDDSVKRQVLQSPQVLKWKAERDLARAELAESKLDMGLIFGTKAAKAKGTSTK